MLESDFLGLPAHTRKFVERINRDGLDRVRIHGLFVLLGLHAGAPNTLSGIDELFKTLSIAVPLDRSRDIDDLVGQIYSGYDRELSEFCYRSGAGFEFREIKVPKVDKSFYIVDLRDHGLLEVDVTSIERLADAARLYDAFISAIGRSTAGQGASLIEAFGCGIMQIQLHARMDVFGSRQIAEFIKHRLPLIYGIYFSTLNGNGIEYFLGLERGQVPLLSLIHPMAIEYAKQMWGFQSSLFYRDQEPIDGVDGLTARDWYAWVLQNAIHFDVGYPADLMPFSKSNIDLINIPQWRSEIEKFEICDDYIHKIWGYSALSVTGDIETLEYKALLVHLVYSSLTRSREVIH